VNNSINIYQNYIPRSHAAVNVVIDVIRAFSTASFAFKQGFSSIILLDSVSHGLSLFDHFPNIILAGENSADPISEFHIDNSPFMLCSLNDHGSKLGLLTTNGVRVLKDSYNADLVLAVSANNAIETALLVHKIMLQTSMPINLIASHPTAIEDLACAHFIKNIIVSGVYPSPGDISTFTYQIINSDAGLDFISPNIPSRDIVDLVYCSQVVDHPPIQCSFSDSSIFLSIYV